MDAAERDIYHYLKSRRPQFVSARDVSRHAGSKRKFRYNPGWARDALARMVDRGILETDAEDSYRLKPIPRPDTKGKVWASPHIAEILKASGKAYDHLITAEDEDEYYDKL
jgi:hypothetical protein